MSHEFYRPSKESRDIGRDQARHAQENDDGSMKEVRLGFARSYTETAKPGDTLRRMIKRAYKDGKLYSERQANEAADRVIALLGTENITKVKHGDRITFRNDMIIFRFFEPQEDRNGKRDVEFGLNESERSVVASSSSAQRAALAEGPAKSVAKSDAPKAPTAQPELTPNQLLAQQRRAVLRAFIDDTQNLKKAISNGHPRTVPMLISRRIIGKDSRIPAQFQDYEFSSIVFTVGDVPDGKEYLIGLNPKTGEVVLFNAATPYKVRKVNVNAASDLAALQSALSAIVNPPA